VFRIGEFSKLAQVSGRLLRYYEELGLFRPEYTDPQTGYRSYSAQQLPHLNRILVLKELGLSLEQIARLLAKDTSTDELRGMLTLRKAQIAQSVEVELARLRMVESRLEQIDTLGQINEPDVVIKAAPAQQFLALREVLPDMDSVRRLVRTIATRVPTAVAPGSLDTIAVVIHTPAFDPDAFDLEVGYLLAGKAPAKVRLSEERMLTTRELPAVETLATLVHIGRVEESHRSYGILAGWLERNGYQIVGSGRELLMQLPDTHDMAVFEIQLPVSKDEDEKER
jgi:DNA-binding transcriptional MerR regulator